MLDQPIPYRLATWLGNAPLLGALEQNMNAEEKTARLVELAHEMLEVGTEGEAIGALADATTEYSDTVAGSALEGAESEVKALDWFARRLRELSTLRSMVEAAEGMQSDDALQVARGVIAIEPVGHVGIAAGLIASNLLATAEAMAKAWRGAR